MTSSSLQAAELLADRPRSAPRRPGRTKYDGEIGLLTISSATITTLNALQCLVEVTGASQITDCALTSAMLPKLRAVGALDRGNATGLAVRQPGTSEHAAQSTVGLVRSRMGLVTESVRPRRSSALGSLDRW
jgi:hypothetical protein